MLTLWGRLNSINVQKVQWALDELGLKHERKEAGGPFGVVDTEEYGRLNPNRLVPVLEDNGFVIWESNAIVRYLAAEYGAGSLWPKDAARRADADRWMDWQATNFGPAMGPAFLGLIRTPPEKRDMAAIGTALEAGEKRAAILDAALAGRNYIAGDGFTMGDIAIGAAMHRWLNLSPTRARLPNVEAWYARLMERPAARKVLTLPLA